MKIADLGVLNAPLALFGGPYSNAQATAALFDKVAQHGVAPRSVICTGDVVAYCANPRETIDGLDRFTRIFNQLNGLVCTMCAT